MNENGKKVDFLIEDQKFTDPKTGVEMIDTWAFIVWADERMKEVIASVEGVTNVFNYPTKTRFSVYYDARYDVATIKAEVAAAIKNELDKGE